MDYILEFRNLNIIRNYLLNEDGITLHFVRRLRFNIFPILDAGRAYYDSMNLLLRDEEMKGFYEISNEVIKRYS